MVERDQYISGGIIYSPIKKSLIMRELKIMKYLNRYDMIGSQTTLGEAIDTIKSPSDIGLFAKLRRLYQTDRAAYKELKLKLPSFRYSGTFTERNDEGIQDYIGLAVLDIDGISSDSKMEYFKKRLNTIEHTAFCFVSPSGLGLKVGVFMNCTPKYHKDGYNQVLDYYHRTLFDIPFDRKTKDISRMHFVSYDPDIYINEEHKIFEVDVSKVSKCQNATRLIDGDKHLEYVINHVDTIEEYREGNRNNYISQTAYVANRHGIDKQMVIDYFVSNSELDEREITSTINSAYRNTQEFGVLKYEFAYAGNEDLLIPKQVYKSLPYPLVSPLQFQSDTERDMALLALLTLSGSLFFMVKGDYHYQTVHPNLMTMIIAPPASGKGVVSIAPAMAADSMNHFNKTEPITDMKRFQLSGNSSSAMMYPRLAANEGRGIMFEQEGDAISNNFKSEWGDITVHLRKSFHNEELTYERKMDRQMIVVPKPRFGMLVTMTPNQLAGLIKNRENGLFSRVLYYVNTQPSEFGVLDPALANKYNIDKAIQDSGNALFKWFVNNQDLEKTFALNPDQFKYLYEQWQIRYKYWQTAYGVHNGDIIKRLAVASFKLMMILSVWRYIERQDNSTEIVCLDEDMDISIEVMSVLFYHGLKAAKLYSKSKIKSNLHLKALNELNTQFKTGEYVSKFLEFGGKDRTAKRWLQKEEDKSIKKIGHGLYKKLAA